MKKIAFFCIPAHGHTNPMLPVAAELVKRGNAVRFYSFNEFETKITATGAEFISCDAYLPSLTEQEEAGLKKLIMTDSVPLAEEKERPWIEVVSISHMISKMIEAIMNHSSMARVYEEYNGTTN